MRLRGIGFDFCTCLKWLIQPINPYPCINRLCDDHFVSLYASSLSDLADCLIPRVKHVNWSDNVCTRMFSSLNFSIRFHCCNTIWRILVINFCICPTISWPFYRSKWFPCVLNIRTNLIYVKFLEGKICYNLARQKEGTLPVIK